MHYILDEFHFGPPTTELAALERLNRHYRHNGGNGISTFSQLLSYMRTIKQYDFTFWLSGERSLPLELFVLFLRDTLPQ